MTFELAAPPNDIPSAPALLEAVRDFLERDVLGSTDGRVKFHTRVAINVLAIVERELRNGAARAAEHAAMLAELGFGSDAELAAAIRAGATGDRSDAVRDVVTRTVAAKLSIANPAYLEGPRPPVDD